MKPASIFYWEAKRRLEVLNGFRQKIADYYAKAHWDRHSQSWDDDEQTGTLRQAINESIRDVSVATRFVGVHASLYYSPPPITGRPSMDVSLLDNVFNLPRLGIPEADLLDQLDQAVGIYRSLLGPLWWSLFNPFYWLGWILTWIARIPFRLLDAAGFDGTKAEGSRWGKLAKAAIQAVTAFGGALGILEKFDLLDPFVTVIRDLVRF